jgi:DNA modification methylase
MYASKGDVVYDSFMGTGTTAVGCFKYGSNVVGSELSDGQFEYSINRLKENFETIS